MTAYYNEHDIYAAAWLRELIKAGEIAPGDVDERSITDVNPTELLGYTQLHFFAGIGGWSRALRLAGIGDDVRIVTGSCPCQPFSSAGKGEGLNDARHLWPHFFRIISHLRPARVVGEQVASPDALVWWDAVCTDLDGAGYTGWAADLCSAGAGAAHIRQRLYWVADTINQRLEGLRELGRIDDAAGWPIEARHDPANCIHVGSGAADWIKCADEKLRPVESGTPPMVDALPPPMVSGGNHGAQIDVSRTAEAREMRLKGYGNAIDPELAAIFLKAIAL
jgi:DNA (cytosine-5)-methyltransferase 1